MFPVTEANLDSFVANVLEPRRTDPRWWAAYNQAYAAAETVWPTQHGHSSRDTYAFISADLAMAALAAQSPAVPTAPPAAGVPQTSLDLARTVSEPVIRPVQPPHRRETVAEGQQRRAQEAKARLAAMAAVPRELSPLEAVEAPSGEIGFAPATTRGEQVASGWKRAFDKAEADRL